MDGNLHVSSSRLQTDGAGVAATSQEGVPSVAGEEVVY